MHAEKGCAMKAKRIEDSETVLSEVMMPLHANHYGNIHGGTILKLVDEAAYVAATKHARENVVLASMDHMVFQHPVRVGDIVNIRARICYAGRTSMEVEVEVETERLKEGCILRVGSAHLTMVALDKNGAPTAVPRLILKTPTDRNRSHQAFLKRKARLSR